MESREAGIERLYPKITGRMSARYYYLIQLRKQLERVIALYVRNSPHQLLADYGCGNKPYEPLFTPFVEQYIGLDLAYNTKADVVVDPAGIIDMPGESVGFVLSTQVLEHVEDPKAYLKEAHRILEKEGKTDSVFLLFQKSLTALAKLQIEGAKGLDYSKCLTSKYFGKHSILTDLLYYKYYFLDTLQYPYDKQALIDEFEILSDQLAVSHFDNFMFRDFQSRNIMVQNGEVYFIDFQGGMQGGLPYDVASLLWQAKAGLSNEWKEKLLDHYIAELQKLLPSPLEAGIFKISAAPPLPDILPLHLFRI